MALVPTVYGRRPGEAGADSLEEAQAAFAKRYEEARRGK